MLLLFRTVLTDKEAKPHDLATVLEDVPGLWAILLDSPRVVASREERDRTAPALCGACYFPDAVGRSKQGVDSVKCLVLDVDSERDAERVPNENELREALKARGHRAIVYASASHTKSNPRWRVLIPLATPIPPRSTEHWCKKYPTASCPVLGAASA